MKYFSLLAVNPIFINHVLAVRDSKDRELYDHMDGGIMDAKDRAEYDTMTHNEKILHLKAIVRKIDYNKDGFLDKHELERWMRITSQKYLDNDIDSQWPNHDTDMDGLISWNEYRNAVYEHMTEEDFEQQNLSMEELEQRDSRRFNMADTTQDGNLNRAEFGAFLHPEDHDHMKDIVVLETLEDLDLDGDGRISEEEYIKDIYNYEDDPNYNPETNNRPDWLDIEYKHFKTIRDLDRDGYLDMHEVKKWLMPIEYDHIEAEAQNLIDEADKDGDKKLTEEEVLGEYDLFFTSQATNWGEALAYHQEL